MPTALRVHSNEDDALLFWSTFAPISDCRGFAIERRVTRKGTTVTDVLSNRIGFAGEHIDAEVASHGKPSTEWPFQRYSWIDHGANTGDTVSYRVVPIVRRRAGAALERLDVEASPFSDPITLGTVPAGSKCQAFFNRGFVMSQFMARYLRDNHLTLAQFKQQIQEAEHEETEHAIRNFLSGDLRLRLLDLLHDAATTGADVFAALFEVSDDELIEALSKLGPRAHVVLANGSIQKKKTETAADARSRDENQAARATLRRAKVDVALRDRFLSPGALGHNKFLVIVRGGKAKQVWTGSTNWAPTGLCTQVNNGILITDDRVAQIYRDQWQRLRDAKSAFPAELVTSNSQPHQAGDITVWFTRSQKKADLDALNAEVQKAKQGVLFLMFMPGATGVLGTVMTLATNPHLFVRGVVSTLPNGRDDESEADVDVIDRTSSKPLHLEIVQPEGAHLPMSQFAAEVTRTQFLGGVGHAIIHSKVLVIDPFSDQPVVITGSHNFSGSASTANDENFVIVRGDKALAQAYAVNAEAAYQHYRWRAFLAETNQPFEGLTDDDRWQAHKLQSAATELAFWGVSPTV
jgi:phosphatidylserine/phosphatidylglycerophosphate/cardiolipin synthase-like enzyme